MPGARDLTDLGVDVSRETLLTLEAYQAEVLRWNARINLVSRSTVPVIWERHIRDSAQIWPLAPETAEHWLDLGSGAGFPGLVIAILARDLRPGMTVSLIESDLRKSVFLQSVARELDLTVTVYPERIEQVQPLGADVISARALSPLPRLLSLANRHAGPACTYLLPKGQDYHSELEGLSAPQPRIIPSATHPDSVILCFEK